MAKNLSSSDCCAAKAAATTVANIIKSFDYKDWGICMAAFLPCSTLIITIK